MKQRQLRQRARQMAVMDKMEEEEEEEEEAGKKAAEEKEEEEEKKEREEEEEEKASERGEEEEEIRLWGRKMAAVQHQHQNKLPLCSPLFIG